MKLFCQAEVWIWLSLLPQMEPQCHLAWRRLTLLSACGGCNQTAMLLLESTVCDLGSSKNAFVYEDSCHDVEMPEWCVVVLFRCLLHNGHAVASVVHKRSVECIAACNNQLDVVKFLVFLIHHSYCGFSKLSTCLFICILFLVSLRLISFCFSLSVMNV